jgi:hypothetical protein
LPPDHNDIVHELELVASLSSCFQGVAQLVGLERRTARGGRDSIGHAPGAHDDLVNCVAGVVALVNRYGGYDVAYSAWSNDDDPPPDEWREQRRRRYLNELMQRYGQPCTVPLSGLQQ